MFEDEEVINEIIYPVSLTQNQILIFFNNKNINLEEYRQFSLRNDNLVKYNYFITLIHLFADLCLKKNYIAIVNFILNLLVIYFLKFNCYYFSYIILNI